MEFIKRFMVEEEGANATEYALVIGLIALAIVVTRFLRLDSPMLQWRPLAPLIVCGRNSLQVFCVGIVHVVLRPRCDRTQPERAGGPG